MKLLLHPLAPPLHGRSTKHKPLPSSHPQLSLQILRNWSFCLSTLLLLPYITLLAIWDSQSHWKLQGPHKSHSWHESGLSAAVVWSAADHYKSMNRTPCQSALPAWDTFHFCFHCSSMSSIFLCVHHQSQGYRSCKMQRNLCSHETEVNPYIHVWTESHSSTSRLKSETSHCRMYCLCSYQKCSSITWIWEWLEMCLKW